MVSSRSHVTRQVICTQSWPSHSLSSPSINPTCHLYQRRASAERRVVLDPSRGPTMPLLQLWRAPHRAVVAAPGSASRRVCIFRVCAGHGLSSTTAYYDAGKIQCFRCTIPILAKIICIGFFGCRFVKFPASTPGQVRFDGGDAAVCWPASRVSRIRPKDVSTATSKSGTKAWTRRKKKKIEAGSRREAHLQSSQRFLKVPIVTVKSILKFLHVVHSLHPALYNTSNSFVHAPCHSPLR